MSPLTLTNLVQSVANPKDLPYQLVPRMFPPFISVRDYSGVIWNQGGVGSCTAQTVRNVVELFLLRAGKPERLSAQFIYDLTRIAENRKGQIGAYMVDALVIAWRYGIPLESEWPARDTEETLDPSTSPAVMASAATRKIIRFERIPIVGPWVDPGFEQTALYYKSAYSEGCPIAEARAVGKQIFSIAGPLADQQYGMVNDPGNEFVGYHAMCSVEWQDALDGIVDEQSWGLTGPGRGENGFIRLRKETLRAVIEAWVIRGVRANGEDYYIEPQFISDQQIREYVGMLVAQHGGDLVAAGRNIWDAKQQYGITSHRLEKVMEWPAGSVDEYAAQQDWI